MRVVVFVVLCCIWGSTWMAIKLGLHDSPPFFTLLLRFTLANIILACIVLLSGKRYPKTISSFLKLGFPGLFMFTGSYVFTYTAEQYITSALTAVLYSSIPLFVAVLSVWLLSKEQLGVLGWLGLFSGFSGLVLISYEHFGGSNELFLGTICAIAGAFCSSLATVLLKRSYANMDVLVTVSTQMLCGLIPIAIITPILEDWSQMTFSTTTILSILYLAIIGTVVAFLLYYWLVNRTRAVVVSTTAFIIPLVAIFIGTVFFDEVLSGMVIPGTVMILLSVVLVILSHRQKRAA